MSIKRETIADTFALISFGLVVGMSVELFVAGLSIEQSLHSRLLSIPVNLLIARPYGIYRDWIMAQVRKIVSGSIVDGSHGYCGLPGRSSCRFMLCWWAPPVQLWIRLLPPVWGSWGH